MVASVISLSVILAMPAMALGEEYVLAGKGLDLLRDRVRANTLKPPLENAALKEALKKPTVSVFALEVQRDKASARVVYAYEKSWRTWSELSTQDVHTLTAYIVGSSYSGKVDQAAQDLAAGKPAGESLKALRDDINSETDLAKRAEKEAEAGEVFAAPEFSAVVEVTGWRERFYDRQLKAAQEALATSSPIAFAKEFYSVGKTSLAAEDVLLMGSGAQFREVKIAGVNYFAAIKDDKIALFKADNLWNPSLTMSDYFKAKAQSYFLREGPKIKIDLLRVDSRSRGGGD